MTRRGSLAVATFGAGCFWGVEEAFRRQRGVVRTAVGYSGGMAVNPSYEEVCGGQTGHAEAVRVEYDPTVVSYERLLDVFWQVHDPTQVDRQGLDVGNQYRSVVFYHTPAQRAAAEASWQAQAMARRDGRPMATTIIPAGPFYPAEEYHQQYLRKRGQSTC